ncbi:hypothetical protein [Novosphingobium sp. JCM 18896]|uniref:hypothetical protein n=1 Tax=Novosphingobium sp. JCM 18896 TaxID=2989731 RepID=UPI002223C962|nr:hypothetical protein [Novosphingobium sp. JCM 18896]MCW1432446.1 hypothetical protein [Novosphingobium sp. JCM 18896]
MNLDSNLTIRLRRVRPLIGCLAFAALSACSSEQAPEHDELTVPTIIGEHSYACEDGSRYDVDFLKDGLTLEFSDAPDGMRQRLTAPATGEPFVGQGMTLTIADGDRMTIARQGATPLRCRQLDGRRSETSRMGIFRFDGSARHV